MLKNEFLLKIPETKISKELPHGFTRPWISCFYELRFYKRLNSGTQNDDIKILTYVLILLKSLSIIKSSSQPFLQRAPS